MSGVDGQLFQSYEWMSRWMHEIPQEKRETHVGKSRIIHYVWISRHSVHPSMLRASQCEVCTKVLIQVDLNLLAPSCYRLT